MSLIVLLVFAAVTLPGLLMISLDRDPEGRYSGTRRRRQRRRNRRRS